MGIKMKTGEVAKFFEVTRRTVCSWKAAGCPCKPGGRGKEDIYDSAETHRWNLAEAVGDGAAKDPELKAARLSILRTESEIRDLKLAERKASVVPVNAVEDGFTEAFAAVRMAFSGAVPLLVQELTELDRGGDQRALSASVHDRLRRAMYRGYVLGRVAIGELAGQKERKVRAAADAAWRAAFPADWETHSDAAVERIRADVAKTKNRRKTP